MDTDQSSVIWRLATAAAAQFTCFQRSSNGWARWAKTRGPPNTAPECHAKIFKDNSPVTVKIRTSGCQTLECFVATLPTQGVYGRLVRVDETFNRFAGFGL